MVKTKCEVYSRVVGYIRPVNLWNEGKEAEFHERKTFDELIEDGFMRIASDGERVWAEKGMIEAKKHI